MVLIVISDIMVLLVISDTTVFSIQSILKPVNYIEYHLNARCRCQRNKNSCGLLPPSELVESSQRGTPAAVLIDMDVELEPATNC